jgi:hypothetical protein
MMIKGKVSQQHREITTIIMRKIKGIVQEITIAEEKQTKECYHQMHEKKTGTVPES